MTNQTAKNATICIRKSIRYDKRLLPKMRKVYMGYKELRKENKKPMEYYLYMYYKWLAGLAIIIISLLIISWV